MRTKLQLLLHPKAEEGKQQQRQEREKEKRDGLRSEVEEVSWAQQTLLNLVVNP